MPAINEQSWHPACSSDFLQLVEAAGFITIRRHSQFQNSDFQGTCNAAQDSINAQISP